MNARRVVCLVVLPLSSVVGCGGDAGSDDDAGTDSGSAIPDVAAPIDRTVPDDANALDAGAPDDATLDDANDATVTSDDAADAPIDDVNDAGTQGDATLDGGDAGDAGQPFDAGADASDSGTDASQDGGDAGSGTDPLQLSALAEPFEAYCPPGSLPYPNTTTTFTITNTSTVVVTWTAKTVKGLYGLSPTSGTLAGGAKGTITVTAPKLSASEFAPADGPPYLVNDPWYIAEIDQAVVQSLSTRGAFSDSLDLSEEVNGMVFFGVPWSIDFGNVSSGAVSSAPLSNFGYDYHPYSQLQQVAFGVSNYQGPGPSPGGQDNAFGVLSPTDQGGIGKAWTFTFSPWGPGRATASGGMAWGPLQRCNCPVSGPCPGSNIALSGYGVGAFPDAGP